MAEIGEIPGVGKGSKRRRQRPKRLMAPRQGIAQAANAGRPRLAGERYSNGRLKPPGPNERVVQDRRALLGKAGAKGQDLKHAENPLDLAFWRGWLSKDLHQAADLFRQMHARSGLAAPRMKVSNPEPAIRSASNNNADPVALYYLARIWDRLKHYPAARDALIEVCILGRWPVWLTELAELVNCGWGEHAEDAYAVHPERHALRCGLAMVVAVSSSPPPATVGRQTDLSMFVEWARGGMRGAA